MIPHSDGCRPSGTPAIIAARYPDAKPSASGGTFLTFAYIAGGPSRIDRLCHCEGSAAIFVRASTIRHIPNIARKASRRIISDPPMFLQCPAWRRSTSRLFPSCIVVLHPQRSLRGGRRGNDTAKSKAPERKAPEMPRAPALPPEPSHCCDDPSPDRITLRRRARAGDPGLVEGPHGAMRHWITSFHVVATGLQCDWNSPPTQASRRVAGDSHSVQATAPSVMGMPSAQKTARPVGRAAKEGPG